MGETRMTALDFRGLSKRDFENGATLDEIYRVFQERDTLRAQVARLRRLIQQPAYEAQNPAGWGTGKMVLDAGWFDALRLAATAPGTEE